MIHNLSETNSILNNFVAEIRDKSIQKDRMRFRRNIERIGEILGYELSKSLLYSETKVETPLGLANVNTISDDIVLGTILRAGLSLHSGVLNYFDKAENGFISAYRKKTVGNEFEIVVEYLASAGLKNKTLILTDPMLATGRSLILCYHAFLRHGTPTKLHIVSAIASKKGVEHCLENLPKGTEIWVAAIDDTLDNHSYIVPGLGDAGDLAYGDKL